MKPNIKLLLTLIIAFGPFHSIPSNSTPTKPHSERRVIVDSDLSLDQALGNQNIPGNIKAHLRLVNVHYYSFDGKLHRGQLVVHKALRAEVIAIFRDIERSRFPIAKVIPISKYNFSDELSMLDNNSSAFNYRLIEGSSKLSNHALGRAIDINPFQNPIVRNGIAQPAGAAYNPKASGTIVSGGIVVRAFKKRGWTWGGNWKRLKDYQHFEKRLTQNVPREYPPPANKTLLR